jgi:membrane protein YdbS with pleckstrin-like domain
MTGTPQPGDHDRRVAGIRLTTGRVELALALAVVVMIVGYVLSGEGVTGVVAALIVVPAAVVAVLSIWWLVLGPGRRR